MWSSSKSQVKEKVKKYSVFGINRGIICFLAFLCFVYSLNETISVLYLYQSDSQNKVNPYNCNEETNQCIQHSLGNFQTNDIGQINQSYLINTISCAIPNVLNDISQDYTRYGRKKGNKTSYHCGKRKIFVKKIAETKVKFIFGAKLNSCCFQFVYRSKNSYRRDKDVFLSKCVSFENETEINLETEFIFVQCENYQDIYAFVKKIKTKLRWEYFSNFQNWNVIILGLSAMSRAKAVGGLKETVEHLHKNNWLDFKGFNKRGSNKLQMLFPLLSKSSTYQLEHLCKSNMERCNQHFIWSAYKRKGYITAFGEDGIYHDSLFKEVNGFDETPTDHYIKPLFIRNERKRAKRVICTKKQPSASRILDYALDFIKTYQKKYFFGLFWINSLSYNKDSILYPFDLKLKEFLEELREMAVFENTFFFLIGDGDENGPSANSLSTFHERRLPMFFMHTPKKFKEMYPLEHLNLIVNQGRLVSTPDIHLTLGDILFKEPGNFSENHALCRYCKSLFLEVPSDRRCQDIGISHKWCACLEAKEGWLSKHHEKTVISVITDTLNEKIRLIPTVMCSTCALLTFKGVISVFRYEFDMRRYYTVVLWFAPIQSNYTSPIVYAATLRKEGDKFFVLSPIELVANMENNLCTQKSYRKYCICRYYEQCIKVSKMKVRDF